MSAPADALRDYDQRDDGTVPALDDRNGGWVDRLAAEDRDADPVIAERQDEVERLVNRGDYEGAEGALTRVRDMQDRARRGDPYIDDMERE